MDARTDPIRDDLALAFQHHRNGQLGHAREGYRKVLECAPDSPAVTGAANTIGQLRLLGEAGWLDGHEVDTLVTAHERLTRARHLACLQRQPPGPVEDLGAVRAIFARIFSAAGSDERRFKHGS